MKVYKLIDFKDVAARTGLRCGKLCFSKLFGWGVQNIHGEPGPHFVGYQPPKEYHGRAVKSVRIVGGDTWELTI